MTEAQTTYQGVPPEKYPPLTAAEYLALDGDFEIHQGELVQMSPNTRRPQHLTGTLYISLRLFAEQHHLGEVYFEAAYVLDADERTDWVRDARQPDVSFVSRERADEHDQKYGSEGPWRLVPDLVVEVVSPTDLYSDVLDKVAVYLAYGVKMALIVDPKTRTVRVHTLENPGGVQLTDADTLSGDPVVAGWSMPLIELFGTKP